MRQTPDRKIILASASPRRKELLKKLVPCFSVRPSRFNEKTIKAGTPAGFAVKAAIAKAKDVARRSRRAIVIGADTIVVLGKNILGKPKDKKHAVKMLKSLSGKTHKVITGLAVVDADTQKTFAAFEATKVKVKKVSGRQINAYVDSGKPLDKAGAYGIQEIEKEFGIKISGDYDNVVGLPVKKLKYLLCKIK